MRQKPNLIKAIIVGEDGTAKPQTVNADDIKPGEKVHPQLPPELVARADAVLGIRNVLGDMSREEWHEGFCRDMHPEREIAVWEHIERATNLAIERLFTPESKRGVVQTLLLISMGTVDIESQTGISTESINALRQIYQETAETH